MKDIWSVKGGVTSAQEIRRMQSSLLAWLKTVKKWNADIEGDLKEYLDAYYMSREDVARILWRVTKR